MWLNDRDRRACCLRVEGIKNKTWSIGEEKKWPRRVFQKEKLKQERISRRLLVQNKAAPQANFSCNAIQRKKKEMAWGRHSACIHPGHANAVILIYTSWVLNKGTISAQKKMKCGMLSWKAHRILAAEANNYRDYSLQVAGHRWITWGMTSNNFLPTNWLH